MIRLLLYIMIFTGVANATIITVPGQFASIQMAIDSSANGDTVVVSPGTYFENINFRGKNIVLTSLYYQAKDTSYISSTVINGSMPVYPDTASCVIFDSGEDSTAVLQGFTITGGGGTRWLDIHGAGTYREGGGILIEFSSPLIQNNIIVNNAITNLTNVVSTGGGGIRIGDGNPVIRNNIIMYNDARYGAGIVLNYTSATVRNNIIAYNTGGLQFGGGSAIWMNVGNTRVIENNTIIANTATQASGTGGILIMQAGTTIIRNNIIRDNSPALQIRIIGSSPVIQFNNIEGDTITDSNIDEDPLLTACFLLQPASPSVDAGDSSVVYNDLVSAPNVALYPSLGTERNDHGVFGGPYATVLNCIAGITYVDPVAVNEKFNFYPNPATSKISFMSGFTGTVNIYNAGGSHIAERILKDEKELTLSLEPGLYFLKCSSENWVEAKKLLIAQ